jgi:hypothetical protein
MKNTTTVTVGFPTYNTIYIREEADDRTSPYSSMCYYEFQRFENNFPTDYTHQDTQHFILTATQTISDDDKSPPRKHPTRTTTDVRTT